MLEKISKVVLDTKKLKIHSVNELRDTNLPKSVASPLSPRNFSLINFFKLSFTLGHDHEAFGSSLTVDLGSGIYLIPMIDFLI